MLGVDSPLGYSIGKIQVFLLKSLPTTILGYIQSLPSSITNVVNAFTSSTACVDRQHPIKSCRLASFRFAENVRKRFNIPPRLCCVLQGEWLSLSTPLVLYREEKNAESKRRLPSVMCCGGIRKAAKAKTKVAHNNPSKL